MSQQHLHGKIGDAIRVCKKTLFKRLKDGADLQTAIAQFFCELSEAFDQIVAAVKSKGDPS